MANIKKSAEELIGRTPLMELVNYEKKANSFSPEQDL